MTVQLTARKFHLQNPIRTYDNQMKCVDYIRVKDGAGNNKYYCGEQVGSRSIDTNGSNVLVTFRSSRYYI